jgi:hypothetical protein
MTGQPSHLSPEALADLMCTLMILCKGTDTQNKPIWAYLCIKPSMASAFKQARERGNIDISEYGTIIEEGAGASPPADIRAKMERDFGVTHGSESELLAAVVAKQSDTTAA